MYMLAISMMSSGKYLLRSSVHSLTGLLVCYLVLYCTVSCMICKYFLLINSWLFFVDGFLCCVEVFQFDMSHLFIFALVVIAFGVKSNDNQGQCQGAQCLCFLLEIFMVSGLKFKSNPFRVKFCVQYNKIVAQFHSFTYCYQLSQHHLLFFPCCVFLACSFFVN